MPIMSDNDIQTEYSNDGRQATTERGTIDGDYEVVA